MINGLKMLASLEARKLGNRADWIFTKLLITFQPYRFLTFQPFSFLAFQPKNKEIL
jgi:hypothetical protein